MSLLGLEVSKLSGASNKTVRDNYAKIIKQIEQGEAVEPKHNPPPSFSGSDHKRQMFWDFASFADKVNHQLQWGGWRLQEEPHGAGTRNYTILYNGLNVGRLELDSQRLEYATADSEISAHIKLSHCQLCEYSTAHTFLGTLVFLICADTLANFDRGTAEINGHLAAYLWGLVRNPGTIHPFSMLITGRPLAYFDQGELAESNRRFWEDLGKQINTAS